MLGRDYIDTFLTSHHPYDYAREHIVYPRRPYYREYRTSEIASLSRRVPFLKTPIRLRPCRPSLLEHHLRESSKNMVNGFPRWRIKAFFNHGLKEEQERVYASRWILVSYYDFSCVNFMQFDIDRHGPEDGGTAQRTVARLTEAARHYGFDIVWTTSPGFMDPNGKIVHGLYAWVRLDQNHFVVDIVEHVHRFLHAIGLEDIARAHEGAYLKKKKLVRLPGQFNVELADPQSFSKLHDHTPIEAVHAFQEAWLRATPMRSEILTSFPPPYPPLCNQPTTTHSSVSPSPLPPHVDTFETMLRWGRQIVNEHYPKNAMVEFCASELVRRAGKELPTASRTRQDDAMLQQKAEGIISYLWTHTGVASAEKCKMDEEDARRFKPHADYILSHRSSLLNMIPERLQGAADRILDLMLERNGRVAAVSIYHDKETPISTYRNWKRIQALWGLTTLVEYRKPVQGKGTCKQWGFARIRDQEDERNRGGTPAILSVDEDKQKAGVDASRGDADSGRTV